MVEKIRPQFINKEKGDPDENISAKDTYMSIFVQHRRERERERESVCVFIDVIYSTRTTITKP